MLVLASAPPEERMSDTTAPTGTADDVVAAALTLRRDRPAPTSRTAGLAAGRLCCCERTLHVMTTG